MGVLVKMDRGLNVLEFLMDNMNQGIMYIDKDRKIQVCNRIAKQITGIEIMSAMSHSAGRITEGDIVIIADNKLGADDGSIGKEELELINIRDENITDGVMLAAVGVYKNRKIEAEYKYFQSSHLNLSLTLDVNYYGFHVVASIDNDKKVITISVNDKKFQMPYYSSVGNMVVLDRTTGDVKFFQAKGYSVRHEDSGNLLRGDCWMEKLPGSITNVDVIGKDLFNFFSESLFTETMIEVLEGRALQVNNKLYELNKRPVVCSIIPSGKTLTELEHHVDSGKKSKPEGVFVTIQDVGNVEKLMKDINELMRQLEAREDKWHRDRLNVPEDAFSKFIGNSPKIKEIKYMAYKASKGKFNVIITGESGTGKSKLAREIHMLGNPDAPFVEVNCNAIAPSLFESELFGYVGGAFTGAKNDGKIGFFESADKGTIFLDEIGEIPLDIQVKLLHVLQNKIIYRVGSSKPIKVDVRVICATNKNLEEEVALGNFRQDLFYRINVFSIEIPPIKERKADLYILINQLLKQICDNYGTAQKQFSGDAIEKMMTYNWPGNVREMENVIERAVALCDTKVIYSEHLKIGHDDSPKTMKGLLAREEARIMETTLLKHNGNKQKAMEELEISKSVFYDKMKRYGLK